MSKAEDIRELQKKVEDLENAFDYPNGDLNENFKDFIRNEAAKVVHEQTRGLYEEFYILLKYLGLAIVTNTAPHKMIKRVKARDSDTESRRYVKKEPSRKLTTKPQRNNK